MKIEEKTKAINLRKQGKTYSEIQDVVKVARSTLSLWLREVGLAKVQKQRLTMVKQLVQKRGAESRRLTRERTSKEIINKSEIEVGGLSERELWLIGVTLYWAEGSKQKAWNVSQTLQFTNSDPKMIKFYLLWLEKSLKIPKNEISFSLAVHENNKYRLSTIIKFWEELTGFKGGVSDRVYFKRHKPSTKRHNLGQEYYGTLRVMVRNSTNLNRQVSGWVRGVCKNCGVV